MLDIYVVLDFIYYSCDAGRNTFLEYFYCGFDSVRNQMKVLTSLPHFINGIC